MIVSHSKYRTYHLYMLVAHVAKLSNLSGPGKRVVGVLAVTQCVHYPRREVSLNIRLQPEEDEDI